MCPQAPQTRFEARSVRRSRPALLRDPEADELRDDEVWLALCEF